MQTKKLTALAFVIAGLAACGSAGATGQVGFMAAQNDVPLAVSTELSAEPEVTPVTFNPLADCQLEPGKGQHGFQDDGSQWPLSDAIGWWETGSSSPKSGPEWDAVQALKAGTATPEQVAWAIECWNVDVNA